MGMEGGGSQGVCVYAHDPHYLYFTSYFNISIQPLLLIWVAEGGSRQLLRTLNASKCPFKVSLCGI